jgi:hypothetical protein
MLSRFSCIIITPDTQTNNREGKGSLLLGGNTTALADTNMSRRCTRRSYNVVPLQDWRPDVFLRVQVDEDMIVEITRFSFAPYFIFFYVDHIVNELLGIFMLPLSQMKDVLYSHLDSECDPEN